MITWSNHYLNHPSNLLMLNYFTTLTAVETIPLDTVESLCQQHFEKYLMITEYGKTGKNKHYHLIVSSNLKRTDKITQLFKKHLYKDVVSNKRTVITKKCESVPAFFSYYFCKEIGDIAEVKSKGYSEEQLSDMWANRTPLQNKEKLKYDNAPYVIAEWIHNNNIKIPKHQTYQVVRNALKHLLKEGYIITHLIRHIPDIVEVVEMLIENNIEEEIPDIKLSPVKTDTQYKQIEIMEHIELYSKYKPDVDSDSDSD